MRAFFTSGFMVFAGLLALVAGGCGDNDGRSDGATSDDPTDSGFTSGLGSGDDGATGDTGDEPPPPGTGEEYCDAGDEAFVKRSILFIQGRRPASIREVRLWVQAIEQIDALGGDGRYEVAMGLARGDAYITRWRRYLYDQLRVNRTGDRADPGCYDVSTAAAQSAALATFIRDNDPAASNFGPAFTMVDVFESALRLDDLSPAYRADLFARMNRPLTGGNVTPEDLEVMRRANYGQLFEAAYLGRRTACMECHNSFESVTWDADPERNRFFPIEGYFELAIYGEHAGRPQPEVYAAFRHAGFVGAGAVRPWGMTPQCGTFSTAHTGDLLSDTPYLAGPMPAAAQLFDLDLRLAAGFDALRNGGLTVAPDLQIPDANAAMAYMMAITVGNQVWREGLGFPLTLLHNFPRNDKMREILQELADGVVANEFSLRRLLAQVVTHPYFNQQTPDLCEASTPYHLRPVFDPFSPAAADPTMRGNGVGDTVHRLGAWVLLDSVARTQWWPLAPRFDTSQNAEFLRDTGIFLSDAQAGFRGVDLGGLLHWESVLAPGADPALGGVCTGPIGGPCAATDYVAQLVTSASAMPGATMLDVAIALKDRVITEASMDDAVERTRVAAIMEVDLDATVQGVGAVAAEAAARRYVGVLLNTPQFMMGAVHGPDQPVDADPRIVVDGTSTRDLCEATAPDVVSGRTFTCDDDGITITQ